MLPTANLPLSSLIFLDQTPNHPPKYPPLFSHSGIPDIIDDDDDNDGRLDLLEDRDCDGMCLNCLKCRIILTIFTSIALLVQRNMTLFKKSENAYIFTFY